MPDNTDMQAVITTAQQAVDPVELDPAKFYGVLLPNPTGEASWDIRHPADEYRDHPRRATGDTTLFGPESFASRLGALAAPSDKGTWLYGDQDSARIVAVLNDHEGAQAGWCDHRLILQLRPSPQWVTWVTHSGRMMSQKEFADLVEDAMADILEPDAATLMEVVQHFHASTHRQFQSGHRVASGQTQLSYVEETRATAGSGSPGQAGNLEIPTEIALGLEPFRGCGAYKVRARFRYRITGGQLQLGYRLTDPDRVVEKAFDQVCDAVKTATGYEVLKGTPPSKTRLP